jgi:hypothetical protein
MKKLLILSFSFVARDPRVMRQLALLNKQFDLHVAGYGPRPDGWQGTYHTIDFPNPYTLLRKVMAGLQLSVGMFESFYWREKHVKQALDLLRNTQFDLVVANDIHALPLSFKLNSRYGVLYDAHEYSPLEFSENLKWRVTLGRLNSYFCKKYIPCLSAMTTVCHGIAKKYCAEFDASPKVVYSAPSNQLLQPRAVIDRTIRLVHHGAALESRCLELMIEMMDYVDDRFTLDFYLVKSKLEYYDYLISLATKNPRIKFKTPVGMTDLPSVINQYDVGVYLLKPVNFNSEFALPNKFFEFVQGRVAIAVGPSPEMAFLIKKYNMGLVANSFDPKDLAARLNALTKTQIMDYKWAAHHAAQDLNFEESGKVLLTEINRCLATLAFQK